MNQRVQSYLDFAVKVFIVAFAVFLLSYALLTPAYRIFDKVDSMFNHVDYVIGRVNALSERFEVAMGEPISNIKMRLDGMTLNPETLYQIALLKEQQGNLAGAVREMSLAVGLVTPNVEMYQAKLKELKARLSASK